MAASCSYPAGDNTLSFRTAMITGASRSGKTVLGNLLATLRPVEFCDEPWLLINLPVMARYGVLDPRVARSLFRTHAAEMMNDLVLLRCANFRPEDLSSIRTKKTRAEIARRFHDVASREDVRAFVRRERSLLLGVLTETPPFIPFIRSALPGAKLLHAVRRGMDVARDVEKKRWFCDEQFLTPTHAILLRPHKARGRTWRLPWWVKAGEETLFLSLSDLERGLYYWCALLSPLRPAPGILTVRYEDLTAAPAAALDRAARFIGAKPTRLTADALARVERRPADGRPSTVRSALAARARALYRRYGYDPEELRGS